jgi:microcystin-dependent protein
MSDPFVGEIRMFGGNFAPAGWAFCQGQLVPISENEVLFNLIGTTYGGDGVQTFAIPDLQGRIPVHAGLGPGITQTYVIGEKAGVESVTLTTQQIPVHNHALIASADSASSASAANSVLAAPPSVAPYFASAPDSNLGGQSIGAAGGSQPHDNTMPYLVISFIISLFGIFPSQT